MAQAEQASRRNSKTPQPAQPPVPPELEDRVCSRQNNRRERDRHKFLRRDGFDNSIALTMSSDAIPATTSSTSVMSCPSSPGRRRPRTSSSSASSSTTAAGAGRMTPNVSTRSSNAVRNRRRRTNTKSKSTATRATVALLALLHCNCDHSGNSVEAFAQRRALSVHVSSRSVSGTSTSSSSSSLNFRQDDGFDAATVSPMARPTEPTATATATASYYMPCGGLPTAAAPPQSVSFTGLHEPEPEPRRDDDVSVSAASASASAARQRMPTWLQTTPTTPRDVDHALQTLHDAMVSTYLSPQESSQVLAAIDTHARSNPSKMGGAAHFAHILVDTMEMGVTSLMAAIQHYCDCYDVREREAVHGFSGGTTLLPTGEMGGGHTSSSLDVLERAAAAFARQTQQQSTGGGGNSFSSIHSSSTRSSSSNDEADQIASDASGLKRTEAVAHTTFRTHTARQCSGSHQDAYANMQNLLLSETRDWRALAIRTAACLYRLQGLQAARDQSPHPTSSLTSEEVRQSRDALHIYAPLASRLGMHRLKNELEGAAFRLQYRRQYTRVMDLGREPRVIYDDNTNGNPNNPHALTVGEGMARVLRRVATNVKAVLDSDPTFTEAADDVVVSARVKEPYSLWRKMLKTGATRLLDVPDALALRVVLNARKDSPDEPDDVTAARERALCYYVQSLCTTHWEPDLNQDGGRFKDYIDSPKPNGYQSLHYTASTWWGGVDWPLEIQVRTGEMHKIAEYGLAAHFDYKENAKRGGCAGESSPPVYRTQAGSRANANLANPTSTSAPTGTRLNDETYLQAVQEWHWQQIDGAAYSSTSSSTASSSSMPSSRVHRPSEEVQGELSTKIGAGYSPDHDEGRAQRVRARAERIAPYIESFTAAQSDLARNHVFVFLASSSSEQSATTGSGPSGTIVSLPSGSCILDALREGAKHFAGVDSNCFQGKAHFGVQRNGIAAASVTDRLSNGDVITLPTRVCNAGEVLTP